ncbi:MAG: hypothetical protein LBJ64_04305 [Deltaproteobacteria bacterium]|jgi:hypothetical protein|nr:hypothetical protein [Deltaproteobacteria bacterium]
MKALEKKSGSSVLFVPVTIAIALSSSAVIFFKLSRTNLFFGERHARETKKGEAAKGRESPDRTLVAEVAYVAAFKGDLL